MKRIFTFVYALLILTFAATSTLLAGNVITYTATEKLPETTEERTEGLHTNAFNVAITSHEFSNGTGTITFAGEVTTIGNRAFYICELTSIEIPSSVTTIGDYVFAYSGLTSITIPESVTAIGEGAFETCSKMTSITIPNSVKTIGNSALQGCSGLTSIEIPSSITTISNGIFRSCTGLKSVTIPNTITTIGENAFWNCNSLTSIKIPNSVKTIGEYAFRSCTSLTSINIPDLVTTIEEGTFYICSSLPSITIPNTVKTIEKYAFYNCSKLASITIPSSVTSIGDGIFRFCSGLTSVEIPNSVETIGSEAFLNCTSLTSITIPSSVKTIGGSALKGCSGLTSITCEAVTPPSCGEYCFSSVDKSIPVYVPFGSVDAYKAANEWKDFTNIKADSKDTSLDNITLSINKDTLYQNKEFKYNGTVTANYVNGGTNDVTESATFTGYNMTALGDQTVTVSYTEGEITKTAQYTLTVKEKTVPSGYATIYTSNVALPAIGVRASAVTVVVAENVTVDGLKGGTGSSPGIVKVGIPAATKTLHFHAVGWRGVTVTLDVNGEALDITSDEGIAYNSPFTLQGDAYDYYYAIDPKGADTITFEATAGNRFVLFGVNAVEQGAAAAPVITPSVVAETYWDPVKVGLSCATEGATIYYSIDGSAPSIKYTDSITISATTTVKAIAKKQGLDDSNVVSKTFTFGEIYANLAELVNAGEPTQEGRTVKVTLTNEEILSLVFNNGIMLQATKEKQIEVYCYNRPTDWEVGGKVSGTLICPWHKYNDTWELCPTSWDNLTYTAPAVTKSVITYTASEKLSETTSFDSYGFHTNAFSAITSHTFSNGTGTITFAGEVTIIGAGAFYGCSGLTSIILPNSVITIGRETFYGCSGLTSLNIPNSVTSIGDCAFFNCRGLTSITCEAVTPPSCGWSCFDGVDKSIPVYVPAGSVSAYKTAFGWNDFTNIRGICERDPYFIEQDTTICGHPYPFIWEGDSVRYGGEVEHWTSTWSGFKEVWNWEDRVDTITRNYISVGGCDSILQLVVRYPHYQYSIIKDTIEEGQAYWGKYTKTGIYYDRSLNMHGCDSIVDEIHLYVTPKPTYTIILSVNNTKYGSVEGAGTYNKGDTCTLTATANNGYHFTQWNDGNTDNPRTLVVTQDSIFTAIFANNISSSVITYTATSKLDNLGADKFGGVAIQSHTFSNGTGTITFAGEVTEIGERAFNFYSTLTSINLPNSVTTIGSRSFDKCTALQSVTMGDSVTTIKDYAFFACDKLTSINLPESITTLESGVFKECKSLPSVNIPHLVTEIGWETFHSCYALKTITIPAAVKTIGDDVFKDCTGLTSITSLATTPPSCGWRCFYGINKSIPVYVPKNSISAYKAANGWKEFTNIQPIGGEEPQNNVITYTATSKLPEVTNELSDGLHTNAFNVAITSHEFSNGTGTITFAGEVTTIGNDAFYGCTGLTSVTIGNSVTTIGEYAFYSCGGLTSITIPNSVTTIGDLVFYNCIGLKSITIPNSVTTIGNWTFSYCTGLTSLNIPNSVTSIGRDAFSYCTGLTSITSLATTPPSCGQNCFYDVDKSIPVSVPRGSVDAYKAANEWKDFTNIQPIGGEEPQNNVITYTAAEKLPETTEESSDGFHTNAFNVAITSHTFSNGTGTITFAGEVTTIGYRAFYVCESLTSITIPNSVTTIGDWAFHGCSDLTSITIPNTVKTIGEWVFYGCGLTSITIPNSVTKIGEYAFLFCTSLTSITIPNSIISIGDDAFGRVNNIVYNGTATGSPWGAKCVNGYVDGYLVYKDSSKKILCGCSSSATEKITLPNSVITIGEAAFYDCSSLTSITIPNSVTTIGNYAFFDCRGLTSLNIPNSVTTIGDWTFSYCTGLTSITSLATTPPSCGEYCFSGVNESIPVYVPRGSVDAYKTANEWKEFTNFVGESYTCQIKTSAKHGYVEGAGYYEKGSVALLIAYPDDGYRFVRWSDETIYNPYYFVVDGNKNIEAIFERVTDDLQDIYQPSPVNKIMKDGTIYIQINGNLYDVFGRPIL